MPKVEYSKTKGLVTATGAGFALNNITTVNGAHTTLAQGTCVAILKSDHKITLPTTASTGDICIIIVDVAGGDLESDGTQLGSDVAFTAAGDGAVCIYDGTEWQVLVSNG